MRRLAVVLALLLTGCASTPPASTPAPLTLPPGALNPAVTQATIGATVCVPNWTKSIRPNLPSKPGFEYDHLISLELGGAPTDGANLWYQPIAQARRDNVLETLLHRLVCKHEMSLAVAQRLIVAVKHDEMRTP